MAVATQIYAGVVAMTLTGASLANNGARAGTLVVNTANKYLDAIISGNITTGATTGTGNAYFLLSSSDATTISFPGVASDAGITLPGITLASLEYLQPGQKCPGCELIFFYRLGAIGVVNGTALGFANISVSQAFGLGGLGLPPQWGLVLVNMTGFALSATATVINFNGITQNIA